MKSSTFGLDLSLNSLAVLFRYLVVRCGDFGLHGIDHILRQTISGFVGGIRPFFGCCICFRSVVGLFLFQRCGGYVCGLCFLCCPCSCSSL